MEINKAHDKLAHIGEAVLQKTMKNYGMKLTGKLLPCDACMWANAQAKNVKKTMKNPATKARERLFLDIWAIDRWDAVWCKDSQSILKKNMERPHENKDQILEMIQMRIDALKGQGKEVKFLRCNNASEQGRKLATLYRERGVQLEYTAPNTL